jgi:hypothetical protein
MFDGIETPPAPACHPVSANPAIVRCCEAWSRGFQTEMTKSKNKVFASLTADNAYRNAMPPLSGRENIRDFVACTAHGMLIGAIRESKGRNLLYAAQIALAAFRPDPAPCKPGA